MIQKIPRYLLTFHSTSGAIAVERFCKKHKIPGRLIPVPREISASCGLSWAVEAEQEKCLTQVELEFAEVKGKKRDNETILLADFIGVKSFKAKGKRLSDYAIENIIELEPLPYQRLFLHIF